MADHSPTATSAVSPTHDDARAPSAGPNDSSILSQVSNATSISSCTTSAPTHDGERHPKGKRKRTAAKDKMILEEAYRNNHKPDKQARLEIVERVSLNEKEVQIWFQNRRQNDRRKSRPLSAEELAALRYGSIHGMPSDDVSSHSAMMAPTGLERVPASPPRGRPNPELSSPDAPTSTIRGREASAAGRPETTTPRSHETPSSEPSRRCADAPLQSFSGPVGYLANRWNLGSSFSTPSIASRSLDSPRPDPLPSSSCSSDAAHGANRSQSKFRLSLSLEGKAELVSSQASPTREVSTRPSTTLPASPNIRRGLQRSYSALPSVTLPPISTLTNSLPPRLPRGRSRDVQAWESCADSERRDKLTAQAENESSGSAIAAISLLRCAGSVLQPSAAKRNASLTRSAQPRMVKKAKSARVSSTYAQSLGLDKERDGPHGKVKVGMLVSPTDSDKENWSPDEDGQRQGQGQGNSRRRPLPSGPVAKAQKPRRTGRSALGEHNGPAFLANRANTAPARPQAASTKGGAIEIFDEANRPDARRSRDDEVERFMRGDVSPSKKGDMDCVAGLLSLSQGAWR